MLLESMIRFVEDKIKFYEIVRKSSFGWGLAYSRTKFYKVFFKDVPSLAKCAGIPGILSKSHSHNHPKQSLISSAQDLI